MRSAVVSSEEQQRLASPVRVCAQPSRWHDQLLELSVSLSPWFLNIREVVGCTVLLEPADPDPLRMNI